MCIPVELPSYCISTMKFRPTTDKPPLNSPTISAQSEGSAISDSDDEEIGFYSDDDDYDDDEDEEKLWEASSHISDEDNITYESLVGFL